MARRVELALSDEHEKLFDDIAKECDATDKEVFNESVDLFIWCVKERKLGRDIASFDPVKREIIYPDTPLLRKVLGRSN